MIKVKDNQITFNEDTLHMEYMILINKSVESRLPNDELEYAPDSFIQLQLAINGIKLAITINGDQIGDNNQGGEIGDWRFSENNINNNKFQVSTNK